MADYRRNIVFGFKRRIEKKNEHIVIPNDICLLILDYCPFVDQWNKNLKSDDIILTDNDRCINHHCTYAYHHGTAWRNIYGVQICDKGQYEWTLRIKKIDPGSGKGNSWKTMFGIVRVKEKEDKFIGCWGRGPPNGYGFIGSTRKLNHAYKVYGEKFENEGDEITMYLDMDKKTLSYKINGTHYGKAFDVQEGPYRMAFGVCDGRHVVLS